MNAPRPYPPAELLDFTLGPDAFLPAPEVERWLARSLLDPGSPLYNPDHAHLVGADLRVLWTVAPGRRQMRTIAGTAELVQLRGHPWVKARQEWQMRQWFGEVPKALITLGAEYARAIDDVSWCALVDHECYHLAQALDGFGCEKFHRDGTPMLAMRGHDAEEFVGVVRRYGPGAAAGGVAELVAAAQQAPEVATAAIASVCGTCLKVA